VISSLLGADNHSVLNQGLNLLPASADMTFCRYNFPPVSAGMNFFFSTAEFYQPLLVTSTISAGMNFFFSTAEFYQPSLVTSTISAGMNFFSLLLNFTSLHW
jgi:hypothetical protein